MRDSRFRGVVMKVVLLCALAGIILGCAETSSKSTVRQISRSGTNEFETLRWRWENYSNLVWIPVRGVGLEVTNKAGTNSLTKVGFSYSPNSGLSAAEPIVISALNMFDGDRAERFLLRVLFGVDGAVEVEHRLDNAKAFHNYTLNSAESTTTKVYFDATKYHNLF